MFILFADDKLNVDEIFNFAFDRVESIAGKVENAGYLYFLLFPQCLEKASSELVW